MDNMAPSMGRATLSQFTSKACEMASLAGRTPYDQNDALMMRLVLQALYEWCNHTEALSSDRIIMTPINGKGAYPLSNEDVFEYPLQVVNAVYVNGSLLPAMTETDYWQSQGTNPSDAPSGVPTSYFVDGGVLVFDKQVATSEVTSIIISASYYPKSTTGPEDELPIDFCHELSCLRYVAGVLMSIGAIGDMIDRATQMMQLGIDSASLAKRIELRRTFINQAIIPERSGRIHIGG